MFDARDDPDLLLASLEEFVTWWHGTRLPWYGIAEGKLDQAQLPIPLRRMYAFAGEWPGGKLQNVFSHQDVLSPFEWLSIRDGKLVFVWENQGVWERGTDVEGPDPPVWVRVDEGPWEPLCDSLAQFLVTFCLHEAVYGCEYLATGDDIIGLMRARGKHVSPLWLNGPYVDMVGDNRFAALSFYVVDGRMLAIEGRWLGARHEEASLEFPELFKPRPKAGTGLHLWSPIPADLAVPSCIRKDHLDNLARKHERQAAYHAEKASLFRQMADSVDKE
jgi:hypothetical protein